MELEKSKVKLRLYGVFNIYGSTYFDTPEDIKSYILRNKISKRNVYIMEFLGNFAGRCDVIRKVYADHSTILAVCDELGYVECNIERSSRESNCVWEYYEGDLRQEYDAFRKKGIQFENDIYKKMDEDCELLRKTYEERKSRQVMK